MTTEQHAMLNAWAQHGAAHFLTKCKAGWYTHGEGYCAPIKCPKIFKTKREAMAWVDNLVCIRAKEWRDEAFQAGETDVPGRVHSLLRPHLDPLTVRLLETCNACESAPMVAGDLRGYCAACIAEADGEGQ